MIGKVDHYMIANGLSELKGDGFYEDVSPFSNFGGSVINQDEFPESSEIMLEFSNASGRKKTTKFKKAFGDSPVGVAKKAFESGKERREERRNKRIERREARQQYRQDKKYGKLDRKSRRIGVKEQEQEAQKKLAESLNQPGAEDALLNQLRTAPATEQPKGMSTGLKVGLIIGGVAVLGAIAYFVIRKKSKK